MAQWQRELNRETELWKLYQSGIDYQCSLGVRANIPKYVDFYEGRQWPPPTESTKNLPRPVINIVKMICRSKKSSILSTPVKLIYKSYSPNTDVEKFNSFAESIQKELGQDKLDREAIDDGVKKGSYFFHYYWDKNAISPAGNGEGSVRCELIDPLNIFFSNPSLLNEQEQKWILIATRKELCDIVDLCDEGTDKSLITSDDDEYANEYSESGKATLLTRYFRIDGEVYCERATKTAIVNRAFKLSPDKSYINSIIDRAREQNYSNIQQQIIKNESLPLEKDDKSTKTEENGQENHIHVFARPQLRATLYPIVCGYYDRKEGSIYGLSEIEGIIPNQKAINFNVAMSLLNAQQCAWGKYIALPNALKGQKISNTPGQVLIDHSGTGNGIKRMAEESISKVPIEMTQALTDMTKNFTGSSEVISSKTLSSNMSGVAIAQLQAQAEVPLEDLRFNFWEAKRKQGLVLAQFYKLYFYNREFIKKSKDANGNDCEICDLFSSSEYENSIFDVVVESIGGTRASVASDISLLDTCLANGKISLETYIKSYPDSAINNKQEILAQIQAEKESEISLLRKELEKYKNHKTVDPVSIV